MTWQFLAARQRVQVAGGIRSAIYSITCSSVHQKLRESDWRSFDCVAVVVYRTRAKPEAITA